MTKTQRHINTYGPHNCLAAANLDTLLPQTGVFLDCGCLDDGIDGLARVRLFWVDVQHQANQNFKWRKHTHNTQLLHQRLLYLQTNQSQNN